MLSSVLNRSVSNVCPFLVCLRQVFKFLQSVADSGFFLVFYQSFLAVSGRVLCSRFYWWDCLQKTERTRCQVLKFVIGQAKLLPDT